jgi:hypothetical protein
MIQKFGNIPPLSLARRIISLLTKIKGFVVKVSCPGEGSDQPLDLRRSAR